MRYYTRRRRSADRRKRLVLRTAFLLVAVFAWSGAAARTLDVTAVDGRVSVEARGVPLGEVLDAVAREAGFRLVVKDSMPAPVNWSFHDVPVEKAVARLLGTASFVSLYAPADGPAGPTLAEVRVLRAPTAVPAVVVYGADRPHNWDGQVAALEAATQGATPAKPEAAAPGAGQTQTQARFMPTQAVHDLPQALSSDDPLVRRKAAAELATLRPQGSRGPLTQALSDSDSIVRMRAVQGLTQAGGEESIASLSKVLLEDRDPRVRRMAARGLGRMNTESAFWALMEANSDDDPGVREAVTRSLATLEKRGLNAGH
jgi:hypothetical protein